jgi:hypothetical protein
LCLMGFMLFTTLSMIFFYTKVASINGNVVISKLLNSIL